MKIQPLQVSKWLQIQALLNPDEFRHLLDALGQIYIYNTSQALAEGQSEINRDTLLEKYEEYLLGIKNGDRSNLGALRPYLSAAVSCDHEHFESIKVGTDTQITRVRKPVVQLQLHSIGYSPLDNKFRPMIFSPDSIPWGLQFSYPQLFQDPQTKEVSKIAEDERFPNTRLFRIIQKWIRSATVPTPFLVEDQRINVPMRLGKECFLWINAHPQLLEKGIKVFVNRGKE